MEDKIVEIFKKYSKSVDTEYNVYNCLIEEDWSNIAEEVVKLFRQPTVMRSACKCTCKNSLQYENCDKLCERWQAEQDDA